MKYWRRKWQPTPVFLTGESHGQRSLVGRSPWGRTESDTTEATQQQQISFTYLIAVAQTSCTVLNRSSKSGHLCLVHDFMSMMLALCLS